MNHFVSVYFNFCGYSKRTKLTKEFCDRYPEICLIEVAYDNDPFVINAKNTIQVRKPRKAGFITNMLINEYIRSNWESIATLTIFDSDLEIPPHFFQLLNLHFETRMNKPYFIQPFNSATDILENPKLQSIPMKSRAFKTDGHTGYIHCYNKRLLEKLGPKLLPESFLIGGYDHLLFLALYNDPKLETIIKNEKLTSELIEFSKTLEGTNVDYMSCGIKHYYHGKKSLRYKNRWELYHELDDNIIESYFNCRKEDE